MIGPVGARRAIALLVIGDAVLGGAFVGVLLRPGGDTPHPARAATSTTVAAPAADPAPLDQNTGAALDAVESETPANFPVSSTTVVPTTAPPAPTTTAARPDPRVPEATTTAPTTTPSTTVAPSSTTVPVDPAD